MYFLGESTYVQYRGYGKKPRELQEYMAERDGEIPPYMPLPGRNVEFRVEGPGWYRKIRWSGKGKLPAEVMDYVKEHGALPSYDE